MLILLWLLVTTKILYCHGITGYASDIPAGPYCATRYSELRCCNGRQDECSAPILGTLCYCDDFCNRTSNEDCCPDYWSYCRGFYEQVKSPGEFLLKGILIPKFMIERFLLIIIMLT